MKWNEIIQLVYFGALIWFFIEAGNTLYYVQLDKSYQEPVIIDASYIQKLVNDSCNPIGVLRTKTIDQTKNNKVILQTSSNGAYLKLQRRLHDDLWSTDFKIYNFKCD